MREVLRWLWQWAWGTNSDHDPLRSRRVAWLLGVVWALNLLDLALTILAVHIGGFHEANPIGRVFMGSPHHLAGLKLVCLSLGSGIFLVFRHHQVTETACRALTVVFAGLSVMWVAYWMRFHV
jgi:hypothetical protein